MNKALVVKNELDILTIGDILVKSGFFADAKQQAQAVVKVLAGAEIGFGPIASMTGVHIIKGKPALSANLIAAAVKRSGKYNYRVMEHTDAICTIDFYEGKEKCGVSTFTKADATRAGTQNMTKFPRNMLFARAISNGAKWFCPDIFGGPVYTPDELGETIDETGNIVEGQYTTTSASPVSSALPVPFPSPDDLTPDQQAAFTHMTPGGKQLGKQGPGELGEMIKWANGNPDNPAAQVLKKHCEVLLDYLMQFESKSEVEDEDDIPA